MSAKKRQKTSRSIINRTESLGECSHWQKNVNNELETSSTPESENSSFCITHLPSEVILIIYDFLTPADLSTMTLIGSKRLRDLTFYIEHANFSSCVTADPALISSFFTRRRVKLLKRMNFNYAMYIQPHVISQFICRCKNLTELSIVYCGIKYQSLTQILKSCPQLEKLHWNLEEKVNFTEVLCFRMKTVHLICDLHASSLHSVYFTLWNFPNIDNAYIHFSADLVTALPFHGVWLRIASIPNTENSKRYNLITNSYQCLGFEKEVNYLHEIVNLETEDPLTIHIDIYSNKGSAYKYRTYMFPPCAQIRTIENEISLLKAEPEKCHSNVSILLTPEILDVTESLVDSIAHAAGVNLKELSLDSEAYHFSEDQNPMPISSEESLLVCSVLDKIAATSMYITNLNLVTVHFTIGSPFKAISKLRFLKTLNIPTCAFFKSYKKVLERKLLDKERVQFDEVVAKCVLVHSFSLVCCPDDYGKFNDNDLYPLQKWSDLKCLSIYSINFRTCCFLRRVAESCKRLQSLSLITVAPKNMCIFIPDLIYAVQTAKNLTFLRVNEERFNPMYERFWDTIGNSSKLQGICIITRSKAYIEKRALLSAVQKLKHLHLFHFYTPRSTDHLFSEVKKILKSHGIVNCSIEEDCNINSFNNLATLQHYHQQPHFCCQHIHFRDIY